MNADEWVSGQECKPPMLTPMRQRPAVPGPAYSKAYLRRNSFASLQAGHHADAGQC